jgi:hypothetical protein
MQSPSHTHGVTAPPIMSRVVTMSMCLAKANLSPTLPLTDNASRLEATRETTFSHLWDLFIANLFKNLILRTIMHAKPFGADPSMKNRTSVPKAASARSDVSSQQRERRAPQLDSLLDLPRPAPPPSRSQTQSLSSGPRLISDISISSASRLSGKKTPIRTHRRVRLPLKLRLLES